MLLFNLNGEEKINKINFVGVFDGGKAVSAFLKKILQNNLQN